MFNNCTQAHTRRLVAVVAYVLYARDNGQGYILTEGV